LVRDISSLKLIGVCGKAGAGKDTFYEHVLKPRGFLRWQMTLHYKVWLVARGYDWDDIFSNKPPHIRKILQEEITLLRRVHGEEIWLNTMKSWMRALHEVIGVQCAGRIAITDLRFLIEMRGIKEIGGKILHLTAADEQANVAPELRGHRSETELDSPEGLILRDAYSQHPPRSMATRLRAARELP
jgi:hypothetical protein